MRIVFKMVWNYDGKRELIVFHGCLNARVGFNLVVKTRGESLEERSALARAILLSQNVVSASDSVEKKKLGRMSACRGKLTGLNRIRASPRVPVSIQSDVISARRGPIIGLLILIRAHFVTRARANAVEMPRRAEKGREKPRASKYWPCEINPGDTFCLRCSTGFSFIAKRRRWEKVFIENQVFRIARW